MPEPDASPRIVRWILIACGAAALLALVWMFAAPHWANRGPYRIGWEDNPPEQVRGPDGQPTGAAVEVVREAARRRGIALIWLERTESSQAALLSGAVDLWPLMIITPERQKILHFSAPYLDSGVSFMVRSDGPVHGLEELAGHTIGYIPLGINRDLVDQYVPNARLAAGKTSRDLIDSVCKKEIDAAFIWQDEVMHQLAQASGGCIDSSLLLIAVPGARIHLGIGSTMQAQRAADKIRDEIDTMFADGSLEEVFAKWGYLSGRNVAYVASLVASQRRERWTRAAAAVLAMLFLLAVWQTLRYRRQTARARLAETALRQTLDESSCMQQRLRLLAHALKSANDCICITDTGDRMLFVNDAFLRTYEYAETELIGKSIEMLRSARPNRSVNDEDATAIAAGGWRGELWNRAKSGREFPIALATSKVRDENGDFIAMVGVSSDITLRKQAEEDHQALQARYLQAQKLESIGRLAGGVAHDFNNLLTVINGYSRLTLDRMPPSDPLHSRILEIYNAGESAAALTRQLLAFSRKQVLEPRVIDLNQVVQDTQPMLERLLGEGVEVRISLTSGSTTVHADPHQLEQIIMNLAVNASDAMPSGGRLQIETASLELDAGFAHSHPGLSPGRYVMLSMSDTGAGMDHAAQQHIFEPFFTTKPAGQGTGLGLSIVQGIVAQSNGHISVHSEPGRGSTFKVFLPALAESAFDALHQAPVAALSGTETILVLEDRDEVRAFVAATLAEQGYRVIEAANAEQALAACASGQEPIHLLLSDVVMPNISGPDLVKKLPHPMKVLFMSGYTEKVIDIKTASGKPADFIEKPFSPAELARKVRDVLGSQGRRILIADDEASVRGFLRAVLEPAGYEVVEAEDGKKALQAVHAAPMDLAIIDLVMPEQEGIETMQALRTVAPGMPLIAISGAFGGQFLKVAQALGAAAVLNKPVTAADLLAAVRNALSRLS